MEPAAHLAPPPICLNDRFSEARSAHVGPERSRTTDRGTVLLFSHHAIDEAMDESPFFWMEDDKPCRLIAAKHRGAFTEPFAARQLTGVFGRAHVHTNVTLHRGQDIVGEADVLVIDGDRLVIGQAKARKLATLARRGLVGHERLLPGVRPDSSHRP